MRNNDVQRSGRSNGFLPKPLRTISSYLRIVSSGASTVARSAVSVASSIVDSDDDSSNDQVLWAGFDKLDCDGDVLRQVLLLGYRSGFQVWDVEEADNVRDLVSKQDGSVSFMQILPKPVGTKRKGGKFADSHPLLVVCADGSSSVGSNIQEELATTCNGSTTNFHDPVDGTSFPFVVRFYSLKSHSYVYALKFRSVVYSVRCSCRVVAVCQASQIHCYDPTTLEREYTIVTNPVVLGCPGSGGVGYGPLAVGPRWLAYSGSPAVVSNSGRVGPQHVTPSVSFSGFPSNGSLVAHYAKESSKQFAAGIVTLGDMGYKKLTRYCTELLPDSNNSMQSGPGLKGNRTINGHFPDAENVGMVIVRDIVSKGIIAQFKAHKSPISALCFDPAGVLLVTASVQGHNINVFKVVPGVSGNSSSTDSGASSVHLYRLQRGFTNAVIQDISFSYDSNWIMISSSRGTSHLFAINPLGGVMQCADASFNSKINGSGVVNKSAVRFPPNSSLQTPNQQGLGVHGPPVTLSVVSRIKNGSNGWRGTVGGAAAVATGRSSSLQGAIASTFHNCKGNDLFAEGCSSKAKYYLLVFSPSGCMIQYALRPSTGMDPAAGFSAVDIAYESAPGCDGRFLVEAIQKWSICQKNNRRDRGDNIDIYGDNGNSDSNKIYPEGTSKDNSICPAASGRVVKANVSSEEKHHLYISEAELQMHQSLPPLLTKPEIYFHSMMLEGTNTDEANALGGELEIERIPTHIIEARPKDLVPIYDHLQIPKFQQRRVHSFNWNINGRLPCQRSGLSDKSRLMSRSSSDSLDSMTDSGTAVAELHKDFDKIGGLSGPPMPKESSDSVKYNDSPKTKTRLETVHNRDLKTGG